MRRCEYWRSEDGSEATVQTLAAAIGPSTSMLIQDNVDVYDSTDFKIGVNMDILVKYSLMLTSFMRIDGRGGYFGQDDMKYGLQMALRKNQSMEQFAAECAKKHKDPDESLDMIAYKLRVMAGHCRLKFDSCLTAPPEELTSMFEAMKTSTATKTTKRQERLPNKQNPFLHYRDNEETMDSEAEEEADKQTVITYV